MGAPSHLGHGGVGPLASGEATGVEQSPSADGSGNATHVSWLSRDFGRKELALLSHGDVEALSQTLRPLEVEEGRTILAAGAVGYPAYIVARGEVELLLRRRGRRALVGIARRGDVVGDVPLLCDLAFPYTARARADALLLMLPRDALLDLLHRHPSIALRWLSSVVTRLDDANRRIQALTTGDLRARMISLLAEEARVSGGSVPLTQTEIGALLGATRQSVNRVVGDLADEGLIRQRYGRIEVVDRARLTRLAGAEHPPAA